jgi:protein-L-isoaspartate O-methyltransferase
LKQLKVSGKMILPLEVERGEQYLVLINKLTKNKITQQQLIQVRFVDLK